MVIKIVEFIDFQNKEKYQNIKYLHLIKNKDGIWGNQSYIKMHIWAKKTKYIPLFKVS